MRNRLLVAGLCLAVAVPSARANLTATLTEVHVPWDQRGVFSLHAVFEPLQVSTDFQPLTHVIMIASGWWYNPGGNVGSYVYVKINGGTYVQSPFVTSNGKQVVPNLNFYADVPETAFNIGNNTLEYYLAPAPMWGNVHFTTFYYKFNVVRT